MPPAIHAKTTYRVHSRLERFYTGGSVCATADETCVVCACGDEVKVVDIATGATVRSLPGDTEPITSIAVSANGKHVFAASRSLTTKAWDLTDGSCFRTWKAHNAPTAAMAVDASGALVATASAAHEIRVWDVPGGFCTHSFSGHTGIVLAVLFHARELVLASAGDDGAVILWDLVTKKRRALLKGHVSAVTALAWTPDESRLLSAGRDQVVVVWDVRTAAKVRTVAVFDSVEALFVLPRGMAVPGAAVGAAGAAEAFFFGTGGDGGQVKVWEGTTGRCLHSHARAAGGARAREIVELLPLPKSRKVAVATADSQIALFSTTARGLELGQTLLGNADEITALCFAGAPEAARPEAPPGLPSRVVLATNSDMLHVLSSASMGCEATLAGHGDTVLALAVAQVHSRWLVLSGSKDKSIRIWDLESGTCVALGSGHVGAVAGVAFAAKGAPFVVSGGLDKLVRVWDTAELWGKLGADAVGDRGVVTLHASATVAGHDKDVNCVAVAPNNKMAVSGSADRTAKLWKLPALAAPLVLRGHRRGVMAAQFAPIDQAVLTASSDATVRLWSVRNGACLKTFAGHAGAVLQATFVSLGTQVASCGSDGLLKLWTVATGENVATFEAHDDKAWALAAGGDNDSALLTGAVDGSLALWQDCTKLDQEKAQVEAQEQLRQQQDLDNAVVEKNYLRASRLAFKLQKPGRLLSIVSAVLCKPDAGEAPSQRSTDTLARLVASFRGDEVAQALSYLRDWNTTARHCHCAQALLHALLARQSPQELADISGVQDTSLALMLYTERHFKRMDRLLQSTFVLDYLLQGMHVYDAVDAGSNGADTSSGAQGAAGPSQRYLVGITSAEGAAQQRRDGSADGGATLELMGPDASSCQEMDPDDVLRPVARSDVMEGGAEDAANVSTSDSDTPGGGSMPGWGAGNDGAGRVASDANGKGSDGLETRGAARHGASSKAKKQASKQPAHGAREPSEEEGGGSSGSSGDEEHIGIGVVSPAATSALGVQAKTKRRRSAGDVVGGAAKRDAARSKQGKRRRASAETGREASRGALGGRVRKKGRHREM